MLRVLLISDTHGNIDIINDLVAQTKADMVIHAGDFGFYDENSVNNLSPRELRLLITHSPYREQYHIAKDAKRGELIPIIHKHHLLGHFVDYVSGKKKFDVPVYAIWGNHEDLFVVNSLRSNHSIENLFILDENNQYDILDGNEFAFSLFGIGGNFLTSKKLFDAPIGGRDGKVWSTLHQYGALYKTLSKKSRPSIFVSHVSPGKEALLTRLMSHFQQNFWLSGHMGAPYTCVWNEFTIREYSDSIEIMDKAQTEFKELAQYEHLLTDEARIAYDLINREISKEGQWFKRRWYINLPDVKDGHALLKVENSRFRLVTKNNPVQLR